MTFGKTIVDMTAQTRRAFGRVVHAHRTRLKLSQGGLARAAGVDESLIRLYELELRTPTLSTIVLLARALGVRPGRLVDESAEQMARG